jgi:hypothetical protein
MPGAPLNSNKSATTFWVHLQQKISAQMNSLGAREIAAMRHNHLGCVPSEDEVSDRVTWYLYRHVLEHARVCVKDRVGI